MGDGENHTHIHNFCRLWVIAASVSFFVVASYLDSFAKRLVGRSHRDTMDVDGDEEKKKEAKH